jgi:hypothetical protein
MAILYPGMESGFHPTVGNHVMCRLSFWRDVFQKKKNVIRVFQLIGTLESLHLIRISPLYQYQSDLTCS